MDKKNISFEMYDNAVLRWKKAHHKEFGAPQVLNALNTIRIWMQEMLIRD